MFVFLFLFFFFFFFFSSRRRHTRSLRDWSSDVCSSDLRVEPGELVDGHDSRLWDGSERKPPPDRSQMSIAAATAPAPPTARPSSACPLWPGGQRQDCGDGRRRTWRWPPAG